MLGSRLARRIVLPLLILLAALFGVLAWVAVQIAESRVEEELRLTADRVAHALDHISLPPEHRDGILPSLAELVGVEIIVVGPAGRFSTLGDEPSSDAGLGNGPLVVNGVEYRALSRRAARGPDVYYVLTLEEHIAQRRLDVLVPVLVAGACGLLAALVFGLLVSRVVVRPVQALAETARRVALEHGGEVRVTGARRSPGEIGDLEEAFERMLAAIRQSEAVLRETERFAALGRLAGGIAHELRNPLTAIRLAVESVSTGDAEDREEAVRVASAEIERLERTLNELLHYVRPRPLRLEEHDLQGLLADAVLLLQPQLDHLQVALTLHASDGATVRADADRLRQAILNLVLNAAQAQPEGGSIELRGSAGRIVVRDKGRGIPDKVRESIFEPFVTTRAEGIGLGLAVVKQVCDEHGFALRFETGADGTTFFIEWETGS